MKLLRNFKNISKNDVALAGGKGASLGEMTQAGISVPPGFVILSTAFEKFLEETDLNVEIDSVLDSVNHKEIHTVENASEKIQALILAAEMPQDITIEVQKFFKNLNSKYVAVRSSATAEDSASAAWAGQLESYLNTTEKTLLENVKKCWASLFTPRAIFYRFEKDLHKQKISVAVVVQKMVDSEKSGIAFSVHPVTQDRNQLIIEAGFGLGEAIVSGQITPDSYVVEKQPRRIIDKNVQTQSRGLYRAENGGNKWRDITKGQGEKQLLSDSEILELSDIILRIENHYGFPCDIEWAFERGKFDIVQSRPITTLQKEPQWIAKAHLNYDYFSLSTVAESYEKELAELVGFPFNYKYENLDVFYDQDNVEKHAKILETNQKIIDEQIDFIKQHIHSLIEASQKFGNEKDMEAFEKWYKSYREFLPALGIVLGLELALERKLKSFLSEDDFHKISFARETAAAEEQKSILELAKIPESSDGFGKSVKDHLAKYSWLGNKMMSYAPFTEEQVISRVNAVRGKVKQLDELKTNRKKLENGLSEVLAKLDRGQNKFVERYREILFLRTERADAVCKAAQLTHPLFSWIVESLGYNRTELLRFSKNEIVEMLRSGDRINPDGRERYHALFINGKFQAFWGSWGIVQQKVEGVLEIKGIIACKGYAKGVVKIVNDLPDLKKFEQGDILVAPYTNPNMVPAMEKAAAIITNIGGLTSHAAIVSRELNKPCIIDTKNATQILSDGDVVEVDANVGIVRILKH